MRKAFASAALLALTVVLAACGGGNDNGGSGTAATAAPATAAAQAAGGATVAVASSKLGGILVDAKGRTLYAFTKDQRDKSACGGQCAANWPAFTGPATAGTGAQAGLLSTAMQANGSSQVTYGGKLLYYFAGDKQAGDTNGQGVGKVWFVVGADGELVKTKAAAGGYP
jgi:predicted lipoprotein with Yx(FWY)xxD motif